MRYALLICGDDEANEAMEADGSFLAACHAWSDELRRRGVLVSLAGLQAASDATTVRVRDAQILLTDGPFADTKEWIAGYDVLDCADLDEAVEIASKHPMATAGAIEVRPFWSS